jgi:hypothetical protein
MRGPTTEDREGWFLLSVETEMNGRSKSTNEKGLSWLFRWTRRTGTRDFYPALSALVSPVHNIFSSRTLFQFTVCVSIAQQSGQEVVHGRLSLNVCLSSMKPRGVKANM